MRWALPCLALLGCGRLGFDQRADGGGDSAVADGSLPDAAPNAGFANPMHVEGISSVNGADPQLRNDGLELWVAVPSPTRYEIHVATRASTSAPFSVPIFETSSMDASFDQTNPAISRSGLILMFISDRTGTPLVYQMRRTAVGAAWAAPVVAPGMEGVAVESLDLMPDGNTLYYVDFSLVVHRTSRPSVDGLFDGPGVVVPAPANVRFPTVSEDELVMFYNSTDSGLVRWARRADTAHAFVDVGDFDGVSGCAPSDSGDADISPDQNWLIIRCPDPWILTR